MTTLMYKGKVYDVPEDKVQQAYADGFVEPTQELLTEAAQRKATRAAAAEEPVTAAVEGALGALPGVGALMFNDAMGKARREENPMAHMAGLIAGDVAMSVPFAGVGAAKTFGGHVLRAGVEGSLFGLKGAFNETMLNDPADLSAEKLLAGAAAGAGFGAGFSAAGQGIGKVVSKVAEKVKGVNLTDVGNRVLKAEIATPAQAKRLHDNWDDLMDFGRKHGIITAGSNHESAAMAASMTMEEVGAKMGVMLEDLQKVMPIGGRKGAVMQQLIDVVNNASPELRAAARTHLKPLQKLLGEKGMTWQALYNRVKYSADNELPDVLKEGIKDIIEGEMSIGFTPVINQAPPLGGAGASAATAPMPVPGAAAKKAREALGVSGKAEDSIVRAARESDEFREFMKQIDADNEVLQRGTAEEVEKLLRERGVNVEAGFSEVAGAASPSAQKEAQDLAKGIGLKQEIDAAIRDVAESAKNRDAARGADVAQSLREPTVGIDPSDLTQAMPSGAPTFVGPPPMGPHFGPDRASMFAQARRDFARAAELENLFATRAARADTGMMAGAAGAPMIGAVAGALAGGAPGAALSFAISRTARDQLRQRGAIAINSWMSGKSMEKLGKALSGIAESQLASGALNLFAGPIANALGAGAATLLQTHMELVNSEQGDAYLAEMGMQLETPEEAASLTQKGQLLEAINERTISVDASVEKGLRAALRGGGTLPASTAVSADDLERLKKVAMRPEAAFESIDPKLLGAAPGVAFALSERQAAAVQFLSERAPKRASETGIKALDRPWQPSEAELRRFGQYVKAARDPLSVLESLAAGHVSAAQVETIKTVYPGLFVDIQTKLMEQIAGHKSRLTGQQRALFEKFLGPAVTGVTPQQHLAIQQTHSKMGSKSTGAQAQAPDNRQKVHLQENLETQAQRLQGRQR